MKKQILATLGAASFALAMSATASHAFVGAQPGGTSGLAVGAPLPEGVFAIDEQFYGKRDGNSGKLGLNIPIIVWSTPFSFYNTRIEAIYIPSFYHSDSYRFGGGQRGSSGIGPNPVTDGRTRLFNTLFSLSFAHDFGNGFGAAFTPGFFAPDQAFVPHTYALISLAGSYTGNGFDLTANFKYSGTFGSKNSAAANGQNLFVPNNFAPGNSPKLGNPNVGGSLPGFADAVSVDLTATKKFGKFEIGFVGFAHTDIENAQDNANVTLSAVTAKNFGRFGFTKAGAVAVGGLIGYDFGKFTLQGDVTREVASRGAPQFLPGTGKETRGMVRVIVPLYVAPPAPGPVVARY